MGQCDHISLTERCIPSLESVCRCTISTYAIRSKFHQEVRPQTDRMNDNSGHGGEVETVGYGVCHA